MLQKPPVNNFEQIEDNSQFNEDFMKKYNEASGEGYFLDINVQYLASLHDLHIDLAFVPKRMKI